MAIAADECAAEALRITAGDAGAPYRTRKRLPLLGSGQHLDQLTECRVVANDYLHSEWNGLVGCRVLAAQQYQRCESRPAGELLGPDEAAAPGPLVGQQHSVVALRQKLQRQPPLCHGIAYDQLSLGPP